MIANFILTGMKPKVNKQHKNAVVFDDNDKKVRDCVDALCAIGYKENEAITKVNIALRDGFRMEDEILKAVIGM